MIDPSTVNQNLRNGELPLKDLLALIQHAYNRNPNCTVRINREMLHLTPTQSDENDCRPLTWLHQIAEDMNKSIES